MPKITEMLPSSYLKQSDFTEEGFIVTIKLIKHENLANEKDAPDFKYVVYFKEFEKGLVLNTTNINGLAKACNSEDTDDWVGKEIIVFVDPNVGYGGQITGGLRVKRYASAQPKQAPQSPPRG